MDDLAPLAGQLHRRLLDELDGRSDIDVRVVRRLALELAPLATSTEIDDLVRRVDERVHGLGPLEPLLADPLVTEIMVNAGPVWVERDGSIERTDIEIDDSTLAQLIERLLASSGRRLDRLTPYADARLTDGSRVHVVAPPMAIDGPCVTIRRFGERGHDLASFGGPRAVAALVAAVEARDNIVVSGATSSGKTSLLNAIAAELAPEERIVTIEDIAELRLPGRHVVRLEARPPSAEGLGELTPRLLLRNALRMRPDRLVVGEVRGAEAFDMIQALNTGHRGSLSTCHANSGRDAIRRVTAMAGLAEASMSPAALAEQVRSAIDVVVHLARDAKGRRSIVELQRVSVDGIDTLAGTHG